MSLLKVDRGDKKPHVKSHCKKYDRQASEEGNHLPCEWVKIHRGGVLVPVDSRFAHEFRNFSFLPHKATAINKSYSTDIRRAALVAHGANANAKTSVAPNNKRYACGSSPLTVDSIAPAPKIKTGM